MKSAIAIRHVGFEDLGAFAPAIRDVGYQVHYWDIGEQDLWTLEPVKTDLLIVLGGPVGAYEDSAYPFLKEEIDILEMIQTDINATWPRERTITPSDVQGDALTLRDAIVNQGWPTLEESRGKVLFVLLDKTEIRDLYVERNPTLENQSMFAIVDEAESLASIVSLIDPIDQQERLSEASATGFMVRTRPDAATVEAQAGDYTRFASALTSGANFITTDFPGNDRDIQYAIWLPEGPVMCHPERAPPHCTTGMIEPWGNYTPISTG